MITHEKLAIAAFVGSIVYIVSILLILQKNETIRVRIRLNITFIWTLAILAWPLIWYNTIDAEYRTLESIPCLLWPVIILGMDINNLMQNTYDNPMISKRNILSMDANTICSLTFAVSSVIGAQRHECCRKIFMFAIIACIAFVLPAPHVHTNTMQATMIEAGQKAVLAYATGFLLGGIILTAFKKETLAPTANT